MRRRWLGLGLGIGFGFGSGFGFGFGGGVAAAAPAKAKPAKRAVEIHLRALDLKKREANVEVVGTSRAPAPNLFTFTDVRDRHFVAMAARCDEPSPAGVRACRLEIPAGYETHKLRSLELHLGGLHSRTVSAPADEIEAAWTRARDALRDPAGTHEATAPDSTTRAPDGGTPDAAR